MRPVPEHLIDKSGDCWIWLGGVDSKGYGRLGDGTAYARTFAEAGGVVPDGLELDHVCRNTICVNPDHLEPVTHLENVRRRYAIYTHCVNGHEFTPENTYIRPNSGHRDCRTCIRARVTAYRARRKAA